MIRVHHLNHSRSQRVLWLLEELGVPYEIVRYERDRKTMLAPPELKQVHPLGKSPVVTDGKLVLAESGAIIETLVETYGEGRLSPAPGSADHQRYRYYMHYAEGSLMPPLLLKLVFDEVETKAPLIVRPIAKAISATVKARFITPNLTQHLDFLEAELARSPWFAGKAFSAADVQMSFPVEAAAVRTGLADRPNLAGFLARLHARPAYQRALQQGGPFDLLG